MNSSDSSFQRTIEARVLGELHLSHFATELSGCKFEFDGISESGDEIVEVYAGIDTLKPGQRKKIANDILKMVLYEKLIGKSIKKTIVVVDAKIEDSLSYEKHSSWLNRAIEIYGIQVKNANLSDQEREELIATKERQGKKFK
jgi:hypothetical protein